MSLNKHINNEKNHIYDSENPLLDQIKKQQMIKDNIVLDEKEKEEMIQADQVRIHNDIKGSYFRYNIMFYGLIVFIFVIPVILYLNGSTINELINLYGFIYMLASPIIIVPLLIMYFMKRNSNKRDVLHPMTMKMNKTFWPTFIIVLGIVIITIILCINGLSK